MAVYTVKVKTRKRAVKTVTRRRLSGNARNLAKAARKYLMMVINYDIREAAKAADVDATKLILYGDPELVTAADNMIAALNEALSSTRKIVKA